MRYIFSLLLFLVSMCAMSQSDIKDLEKKAKKGDVVAQRLTGIGYLEGYKVDNKKAFKWFSLAAEGGDAEAMYRLGKMYEDGKVKDGNSEMAWSWYVKAANVGNVASQMLLANSLKEQNKITEAKDWYFRAAFQENADAQYEYAMILLSESNESEAKSWFKKAADKNHILAKIKYDAIVLHEREVAEAEAKRLALEAARRDSIARVEAERLRLQSEELRRQDSIDIASGRKLPTINWLTSNCVERNDMTTDRGWGNPVISKETNASMWGRFSALCNNDQLLFFGKDNLDDLDKALYKKSSEFQRDKKEFDTKRNGTYAVVVELKNNSMKFSANGFTINSFATGTLRENPIYPNYLRLPRFLFPVKPQIWVKDGELYKFACSDVDKLQQIRTSASDMALLLVFKPFMGGKVNSIPYSIANPIGLYLVNLSTGTMVLNLSNNIRKPTMQAEKTLLARGERFEKAEEERNKPKYHKQAKEITCIFCGGKGYTEYFPVGSATLTRSRCTNCYGRGYTMEHYY